MMDNNERQSSLNNTLCGRLLVEELVRCGVMDFVIAPGSRSTPIVEAIVRHPVATLHVVVDERSAAFFALGYGRRQRTPAVMVTTSGSAIGHALPAIMEADQSDVPMIVISADRPVELRHSGANQTYEQVGIFSGRVRWQLDLPCPTQYTVFEPLLMSIGQAVANSAHGPVHLNMQFRKPLGPVDIDDLAALCLSVDQGVFDRPAMARWLDTQEPFCRWYPSARAALLRGNTDVSEVLALAQRGMLLIGGLDDDEGRAKAHELAMTLGWPVWADITSGLRGTLDGAHLGLLDAALSGSDGLWSETPDVVLRVGGTIVSERVQRWASTASRAMVAVTPRGRRHDPFHGVTHQVATSLTDFGTILSSRQLNTHLSSGWTRLCERLRGHGLDVKASIVEHGGTDSRVALRLFEELPSEVAIWVASSMPIRLLDTFGFEPRVARDLTASRGVSGIDGMFAQAVGWAQARQLPVVLLLGDLAALHDLGSLSLLKLPGPPVVAVVINNGGGGIFSMLPIREHSQDFEAAFAAAHPHSLASSGALVDLPCFSCQTDQEVFDQTYESLQQGQSALIEIRTDRQDDSDKYVQMLQRAAVLGATLKS